MMALWLLGCLSLIKAMPGFYDHMTRGMFPHYSRRFAVSDWLWADLARQLPSRHLTDYVHAERYPEKSVPILAEQVEDQVSESDLESNADSVVDIFVDDEYDQRETLTSTVQSEVDADERRDADLLSDFQDAISEDGPSRRDRDLRVYDRGLSPSTSSPEKRSEDSLPFLTTATLANTPIFLVTQDAGSSVMKIRLRRSAVEQALRSLGFRSRLALGSIGSCFNPPIMEDDNGCQTPTKLVIYGYTRDSKKRVLHVFPVSTMPDGGDFVVDVDLAPWSSIRLRQLKIAVNYSERGYHLAFIKINAPQPQL
jgi:hypothetical protein